MTYQFTQEMINYTVMRTIFSHSITSGDGSILSDDPDDTISVNA